MINYTIEDFNIDAYDLAVKIDTVSPDIYGGIYGIPKGGIAFAVKLSERLSIPLIELKDIDKVINPLIVDDVVDSGATRKKFAKYDFASIHIKNNTPKDLYPTYYMRMENDWIKYWWEKEDSPIEDNLIRILQYIGEDPNREGLLETPQRIIRAYDHIFSGYKQNAKKLIKTFSESNYDEMVLLKDVELYSMCEHHILPFFGKAHVAYIPDKRVIGISKLARLVDMFSKRLQIQERLCDQITECLMNELHPLGAACVIEAQHLCMKMRGIEKQNSVMVTSSLKGVFKDKQETRQEFMRLINHA